MPDGCPDCNHRRQDVQRLQKIIAAQNREIHALRQFRDRATKALKQIMAMGGIAVGAFEKIEQGLNFEEFEKRFKK